MEDIDDSVFAVISPGQSVTVNHECKQYMLSVLKAIGLTTCLSTVLTLFDFVLAGPGMFTFRPVTSFQTTSPKARLADAVGLDHLSISSSSVDMHISGDLAKWDLPILDGCAVDICTSSSQESFINVRLVFKDSF